MADMTYVPGESNKYKLTPQNILSGCLRDLNGYVSNMSLEAVPLARIGHNILQLRGLLEEYSHSNKKGAQRAMRLLDRAILRGDEKLQYLLKVDRLDRQNEKENQRIKRAQELKESN